MAKEQITVLEAVREYCGAPQGYSVGQLVQVDHRAAAFLAGAAFGACGAQFRLEEIAKLFSEGKATP